MIPLYYSSTTSSTTSSSTTTAISTTTPKLCGAGEWTVAAGECKACEKGTFRAEAPVDKKVEDGESVCVAHKTCKAGEWTEAVGTPVKDTTCVKCPAGTARAKAPTSSSALEAVSSCTPCADKSLYSDEAGLAVCKACPDGHFGVIEAGSTGAGGHKACEADTCERPTSLPANSVVVSDKCPEHGKQKEMLGTATVKAASTCTLSCAAGFYSSATSSPFTCLPDGKSTTASYQGGAITCTGALRWFVVKTSPVMGSSCDRVVLWEFNSVLFCMVVLLLASLCGGCLCEGALALIFLCTQPTRFAVRASGL